MTEKCGQSSPPPPPPPPAFEGVVNNGVSNGKQGLNCLQRFHPYQRPSNINSGSEKTDLRLLRRQNSDTIKQIPTDPRQRGSNLNNSVSNIVQKLPQVNTSRDPRRR